jgi:ribosomal protein L12E/L44/L45/RPP1/RPP2
MSTNEQLEVLFNQLVAMFHFAALQQMGKLKNPMTDKIERDLQQSKISIDMLEMLHAKTKGNLTPDEERHLSTLLRELRLNYVDEAAKNSPAPQAGSPAAPAAGEASPAEPAAADQTP